MKKKVLTLIFASLVLGSAAADSNGEITILSYNVWHGIDGRGIFKMGEYETKADRRARYDLLVPGLREINPDIIGIQEANKVGPYSRRLARAIGHKAVWRVGNSGVRLFGLGIPVNFMEGLAVLARQDHKIEYLGGKRLSGKGIQSKLLSLHTDEVRYIMAARVYIDGKPIIVFNAHTHFSLILSDETTANLDSFIAQGLIDSARRAAILEELEKSHDWTENDIRGAAEFIKEITRKHDHPYVVLGDFNTTLESEALSEMVRELGLLDTYRLKNPDKDGFTWDPGRNPNTWFDGADHWASGKPKTDSALLTADFDMTNPRRIDFIFLSVHFSPEMILSADLLFNEPVNGRFISDHFGVKAVLKGIPD